MSVYGGPEIVSDGLVLCLDAANRKSYPGSGTTWTDLSGLGNHSILQANVAYSSSNTAMYFDGNTSSYTSFTAASQLNLDTCSYSMWYYPTQYSPNNIACLFSRENARHYLAYTSTGAYQIFLRGNLFTTTSAQLETTVSNANTVTLNRWQQVHLNIDWPNSTWTIYHNGSLVWSLTNPALGTSFLSASSDAVIGSRYAGGSIYRMIGNLSGFAHYNKILSASEIQQNFNPFRGRFGI